MMTATQRAAMQAAHDALIEARASMHDGRKQDKAITLLAAAMVEPEPADTPTGWLYTNVRSLRKKYIAHRAGLPEALLDDLPCTGSNEPGQLVEAPKIHYPMAEPVAWMWRVADSDWQLESTCPPERPLAIVEPLYTGYMADAYIGAREEVEIWKRRALEAEKKLQAEIARLTAENEALREQLAKKQVIGSGRAKYDRLIKAARNIVQSINASSSWGCVGPDDTDIAWQEFNALASDVCALIDSPPSSILWWQAEFDKAKAARIEAQTENEALKAKLAKSGLEKWRAVREAVAAEREACADAISARGSQ